MRTHCWWVLRDVKLCFDTRRANRCNITSNFTLVFTFPVLCARNTQKNLPGTYIFPFSREAPALYVVINGKRRVYLVWQTANSASQSGHAMPETTATLTARRKHVSSAEYTSKHATKKNRPQPATTTLIRL